MIARGLTALAVTLLLAAPAFAQDEPPLPPPTPPAEAAPPAAAAPAAAAPAATGKRFAKPGVIEIGGGISMAFSGIDESGYKYKQFTLGLSPGVQYFIIKGLSVGGKFQVDYTKIWETVAGNDSSDSRTAIAILPTVEYNFDLGGRLFPYAGASLGYGYTEIGDTKINQMRFIVEGGVKMTFGHGLLGLGLQIPVTYHSPDVEGATTYTEAGFAIITRYGIWF